MPLTTDIQALTYALLNGKVGKSRLLAGTLTDTLSPKNLPAIIYEIDSPASVSNAPRTGRGTAANITFTALASSRVAARDTCDAVLSALMDSVGERPPSQPDSWFTRVTITQEPVSVTSAPVSGGAIHQYSAVARVIARRDPNR